MGALVWLIDVVLREVTLFAAAGLLVGGIDDLAVDLIFIARLAWARAAPSASFAATLDALPPVPAPGRLAVFVPAWDEAAVIGAMLSTALARFDHPRYRLYVGCYPNDPATMAVVGAAAARDGRVRPVVGDAPGPTTKADCLNKLWRAMLLDDAAEGETTLAVVFHDAEDVVHRAELLVFDALVRRHQVIQLPVLPLVQRGSRLVGGHYCDEFAESHAKGLVVRELVGAALPLAGVGCAVATDLLHRIAAMRDGLPFDAASLTEDYELGLHAAAAGGAARIAAFTDPLDGSPVAVRAFFPAGLHQAVVQKARWMTGIALAGWDRVGWGRWHALGDHWMRMRDRRAPLDMLVLGAAYFALVGWAMQVALHRIAHLALPPFGQGLRVLLGTNAVLLCWRAAMRATFTARAYGWREAPWALLRMPVANLVSLLAARRALVIYCALLRGGAVRWDKTVHAFPADPDGAGRA